MTHVNDLVVHSLDASASKTTIEPILSLSDQIFNTAASSPTHHSSLDEWHKRLSLPSSVLLYARDTSPSSTEGRLVGFMFAHPKTDSSLPCQTLHIWLAGVTERELSVCTYPGKFGKMFAILQKTGWKVWAWMEGGEKVLMIKTVL
ncbi:hypothetical protein LTR99_009509 [Exophiala xenobiotica]|uniref:Ornithine decarboxylase antizyme n=1 Tax=Vermiconidia calcicola TaxID=1690605 RepID=A0AAV9PYH9_9PEZI|nr:hypothetical protein LTR99_009509 [Exophiala xenobiotica]KAK5428218.1 hypothetical protein LTR34_008591 [Exophiala xenobiotica]KAK5530653.1 hypothetical protein LTR23_010314 [Chaetothyriales sp. CCFEE 6169]KAK5530816.1 hypothetical protein LTR25_008673 [Vermiconidia calcicola]KAK5561650.1 hypothetical protein LTR46_000455 [Exophiala xenobiotica]